MIHKDSLWVVLCGLHGSVAINSENMQTEDRHSNDPGKCYCLGMGRTMPNWGTSLGWRMGVAYRRDPKGQGFQGRDQVKPGLVAMETLSLVPALFWSCMVWCMHGGQAIAGRPYCKR